MQRQPLARRIVIAFTLMTLLVSGVFSLGIVGIVHFIEEQLVSEELGRELDTILQEDLPEGRAPRLDSRTRFFASNIPGYAIPPALDDLDENFTELVSGEEAYYAYMRRVDGERYVLMQEQHEFEAREDVLFNVVLGGFLLSVAAAWLLGRLLARRVMAPVTRLAEEVRHRDPLGASAAPLAPEYADDEVGRLAEAFDSTLGQLRLALERERLFTSDVSHELRTPLMVVLGSCELLAEADLPRRSQFQVARIRRAAEEMRELVQIFLLLARAAPETVRLAGGASLATVAAEQSEHWGPQIRAKGLAFESVGTGSDQAAYNGSLLGSVMSNLLRNALHYTERGGVRLVLETDGFRVEDTGVGIPTGEHARLFEPFVRGEQARGEGLGLGLSLVKRICAQQGWEVVVHDRAEGGSCFEVSLKKTAS